MQRISRRALFAAGAAVVIAACTDDTGSKEPPATATPLTADTTDTTGTTGGSGTVAPQPSAGAADVSTTAPPAVPVLPSDPFTLGVASGDPDDQSVILWTRLAPSPLDGGGMPSVAVPVTWEISSTEAFDDVAQSGEEVADPANGHAVHATVTLPQGDWFYRFRVGEHTSPVGRTRCAPPIGSDVGDAVFAAACCQNYEQGYYAALRDIAEQRPDFVVWLGDYIYEGAASTVGAGGTVRTHGTDEARTLDGYRNRYALYRSDPNLRAAHSATPWFVMWDDHEVENNYAGLTPQDVAEAPGFADRRFAAYRAWWEHMPVRLDPPSGPADPYRTYRNVLWGGLLGITLLDGRQYRTDQACGDVTLSLQPACPETTAPGRTMLGDEQQEFLFNIFGNESTVWNVIGNQTVMTDVTIGSAVLNYDQWDGYPAQRQAIFDHLVSSSVPNVVVLTGDIHAAIVGQLRDGDRATGTPVGVEFVSSAISSSALLPPGVDLPRERFPDVYDVELEHRGYVMHRVTARNWIAEYRTVDDITDPDSALSSWKAFAVDADGSNTVREARFA